MNFSILTFNTLFNNAFKEMEEILKKYSPDILCFQEFLINEENIKNIERYNYSLAEYNNSFIKFGKIYGVATFYKKNLFKLKSTEFINPANNLSEFFFYLIKIFFQNNTQPKTILKTCFLEKKTNKKIDIYNIHLFVVGSNQARISTIKEFMKKNYQKTNPMIICGDFNYYPIQRKKLEKMMNSLGFFEATKKIFQTINPYKIEVKKQYVFIQKIIMPFYKIFEKTFKIDYVFYKNLKHVKTIRIENHYSDHYPIISYFKF
ncbi:MAG: endonuclease/exonuclease/phosphatase family protein [Patescibacteria group bacterium]|nr:endonuclease/exonuclease/phosphatase family protein [Patescibacteria group bacterium]